MNQNKKLVRILSVVICILLILLVVMQRTKLSKIFKKTQHELVANGSPRLSLDWAGVYKGILPCADCEGIKVQVILNSDETYKVSYIYMGKDDTPHTFSGTFAWNEEGTVIRLPRENFPTYYKVGEGELIQLDIFGNRISGDLADMYILTKIQ